MAIIGIAAHLKKTGKIHIITHEAEHKSVLGPVSWLQKNGFRVTIIPAGPEGYITEDDIAEALTPQTGLVSIQAVNNELGTIQPAAAIAARLKDRDIFFHTDAAQALGKLDFSVRTPGMDMATISAQKSYGPRGIAALYIREDVKEHIEPLLHGGSDEENPRPGSLPIALCAGFGTAADLAVYKEAETIRFENMREQFLSQLKAGIPNIIVYGPEMNQKRVPNIISLRILHVSASNLARVLPDVAFGIRPNSHIIGAITRDDKAAQETIRISFGRFTSEKEITDAADFIIKTIKNKRLEP